MDTDMINVNDVKRDSQFWSINIGNVLTVLTIIGGGWAFSAGLVSKFTEASVQMTYQKEQIAEIKANAAADRARIEASNLSLRDEIFSRFDENNKRLDQLEWEVQHPQAEPQMNEPGRRIR